MARLRCLLVGAQEFPMMRRTLATGLLKACVEAEPSLRGLADVELLDLTNPAPEEIVSAVAARAPDVVGFSCYVWNTLAFSKSWPGVRRALPGALIVLGGPEVYPRAKAVLEENPDVDVVVVGEAERSFPRLLAARLKNEPWARIPGLAFREGAALVQTPEAPAIQDLDSLPSAYLTGAAPLTDEVQLITLESSRGCPFDCKYCDWPGRKQKPREFSIDRVIAELTFAVERAPSLAYVLISDSDLFVNKARAKELLRRARQVLADTTVRFAMEVYLGRLDDELIDLLNFPNFVLQAGIQTTTPEALEAVDRFFHRDKNEAVVAKINERDPSFKLILEFIYGLPGDSLEGFRSAMDWALSLKGMMIDASPALVLPGADMGQRPERYDMVYDRRPPHRILSTSTFPAADLARADGINYVLNALQHILPVRIVLGHLGEVAAAKRPRPFLSLYEEFAQAMIRAGLLAPPSWTSTDGGPSRDSDRAASSVIWNEEGFDRMMEQLKLFSSAILEECGRLDIAPVFERYWQVQDNALLWARQARRRAAGLAEPLSRAWRGRNKILWLGLEDLHEETALFAGAPAPVETAHFLGGALAGRDRCRSRGVHVKTVGDWKSRGLARAADAVVVSQLFTRLAPAARRLLLDHLREATASDCRLTLWDDLLGGSALENRWTPEPALKWTPPAAPWSGDELRRELAERGWRACEEPAQAWSFQAFQFVKGACA